MTTLPSDPTASPVKTIDAAPNPVAKKPAPPPVQPVLEKLFELYPQLFGANFLPLKLGVYHELLALHPEHFQRDTLKAALGVHTRSTRYLQCVAAGKARHDLHGIAGDPVAPEHIYLAILELHRRRQIRSKEDLSPQLAKQIQMAFEASGLSGSDYLARLLVAHEDAHPALQEAIAEQSQRQARQEALFTTFEASGKSPEEFADMYGMPLRDVKHAIESHRRFQPTA
jgi:ProP effector